LRHYGFKWRKHGDMDQDRFIEMVETELMSLHDCFARNKITPGEFTRWNYGGTNKPSSCAHFIQVLLLKLKKGT
jgi:hypothetical protein